MEMPSSSKNDVNDDLHMSLAFRDFYARTTEYDALTKWFEDNVANKMNIEKMLCVGSGLGFDLILARKMKTLKYLTMIDKNESQLKAATQPNSDDKFNIEIKCISIEDFIPKLKYDLILFSHVLYYISDRINVLNKAISMLSDHGFILIFHQTEKGVNELQRLFNSTKYSYCLNDLTNDLDKSNIIYKTLICDSTVTIDSPTKELCDFFMEKNCSPDEFIKVSSYLRTLGSTLYHPSAIITIQKPLIIS